MSDICEKFLKSLMKNMYSSYHHPPYLLERKLVKFIQQLDEKNSIQVLDEINSLERASLSSSPLTSLKYSKICSCTIYTRSIIEAGIDSETAFIVSDYYINKIDESNSQEEIKQIEYEMVRDCISLLKVKREYIYNSMINKSISYINKNREHRITLREIADYVHVNPNYLSSAFKKEVGINISDYIDNQKIELIIYFITQTTLSLSEIAYTFNFSSQAHFSTFFKRKTGTTPLKYRKQFATNN